MEINLIVDNLWEVIDDGEVFDVTNEVPQEGWFCNCDWGLFKGNRTKDYCGHVLRIIKGLK